MKKDADSLSVVVVVVCLFLCLAYSYHHITSVMCHRIGPWIWTVPHSALASASTKCSHSCTTVLQSVAIPISVPLFSNGLSINNSNNLKMILSVGDCVREWLCWLDLASNGTGLLTLPSSDRNKYRNNWISTPLRGPLLLPLGVSLDYYVTLSHFVEEEIPPRAAKRQSTERIGWKILIF